MRLMCKTYKKPWDSLILRFLGLSGCIMFHPDMAMPGDGPEQVHTFLVFHTFNRILQQYLGSLSRRCFTGNGEDKRRSWIQKFIDFRISKR